MNTTLGGFNKPQTNFPTKWILIDRIDMKAHVWEYKEFGKQKHKEKYLEKQLEQDWNEDQNQYPKYPIFLWFFQSFKTK